MITIEYHVKPEDTDAFIDVMQRLGEIRQRNGGYMWELFNDIDRHGVMIEFYMIESNDRHASPAGTHDGARQGNQGEARAYHNGSSPPKVTLPLVCRRITGKSFDRQTVDQMFRFIFLRRQSRKPVRKSRAVRIHPATFRIFPLRFSRPFFPSGAAVYERSGERRLPESNR